MHECCSYNSIEKRAKPDIDDYFIIGCNNEIYLSLRTRIYIHLSLKIPACLSTTLHSD